MHAEVSQAWLAYPDADMIKADNLACTPQVWCATTLDRVKQKGGERVPRARSYKQGTPCHAEILTYTIMVTRATLRALVWSLTVCSDLPRGCTWEKGHMGLGSDQRGSGVDNNS